MRAVSSGFWHRLQADHVQLIELIELETRYGSWYWTSANEEVTYTLSGSATKYTPFPGTANGGLEQTSDLSVSVVGFSVANTGDLLSKLIENDDIAMADVKFGRVFADTPDLGRIEVYHGKLGDYVYTRQLVSGQARNKWNGLSAEFPYYTYQDRCAWKFGSIGCGFDTSSITLQIPASSVDVNSSSPIMILTRAGVLSNSFVNGLFDYGRLLVVDGVNSGQIRTIRSHSGDAMFLSHPLPINSMANLGIAIHPGCKKRKVDDCQSLYNNVQNFLGFPEIPIQENAF